MDSLPSAMPAAAAGDYWPGWGSAVALVLAVLPLAYLLAAWLAVRWPGAFARRHNGWTLRGSLSTALALVAVVPALGVGLVLAERTASQLEERTTAQHEDRAEFAARGVSGFLGEYETGVRALARSLDGLAHADRAVLPERLRVHHELYPRFLTMLAAAADGRVVTATSVVDGVPEPVQRVAVNIADRPYLRVPLRTGRSYVSEVFRGRGLGSDPIVAVSAPVRSADGGWWGIVEGSLDLTAFSWFEDGPARGDDGEVLIVDQRLRVIYGGAGAGYESLDSLAGSRLLQAWRTAGGAAFSYRDDEGDTFLVASAVADNGWVVLSRVPLRRLRGQVLADYAVSLAWILGALAVSLLLAALLSRRLSLPLQRLADALDGFRPEQGNSIVDTPSRAPAEVAAVYEHLNRQGRRLEQYWSELLSALHEGEKLREDLRGAIDRRDEEIAARTRELQTANAELELLTRTDSLTGLANRRRFAEFIDAAWRAGMRERQPVALVLIDVDCFKRYNDSYGHQAGDECLRRVATAIGSTAGRAMDLVARYGGEEIVMVLTGNALDSALLVAERARAAVQALAIEHRASDVAGVVTVSVGVSVAVPAPSSHPEPHVALADEALYAAKKAGRNVVAFVTAERSGVYRPGRAPADPPSAATP